MKLGWFPLLMALAGCSKPIIPQKLKSDGSFWAMDKPQYNSLEDSI